MTTKDIDLQKNKLIEQMGVYLEKHDNMAPLEARIFSTLILTGKTGITFEQLVADLSASKSTICTHLNTLQVSGRANYYTKPGDRKRYFTVTPNQLIQVMDDMLQKWEEQKILHSNILSFKEELIEAENKDSQNQPDLNFHKDYLQFLNEVSLSVKTLKKKISEKNISNE